MRPTVYLRILALSALAASCQTTGTAPTADTPTGKVSIRDEIIGHTFRYTINGRTGTVTYRRNSLTIRTNGLSARGELRVSGDRLCSRFTNVRSGQETCFTVTRTPYGFRTSHGGTLKPV